MDDTSEKALLTAQDELAFLRATRECIAKDKAGRDRLRAKIQDAVRTGIWIGFIK